MTDLSQRGAPGQKHKMTELEKYNAFFEVVRSREMRDFHIAVNEIRPDLLPLMVQSGVRVENGKPVKFWIVNNYTLVKHEAPALTWQQRKAIQFIAWLRRVAL